MHHAGAVTSERPIGGVGLCPAKKLDWVSQCRMQCKHTQRRKVCCFAHLQEGTGASVGAFPPLSPQRDAHQELYLAGGLWEASQASAGAAARKTRMAVKWS